MRDPYGGRQLNACPVDYVARAIAHTVTLPSCCGHCFHITNPHVFRFNMLFELLVRYGYPLAFDEYMEWRDALMHMTLEARDNALYPLLHFVLDDLPTKSKSPPLDAANLRAALPDTITCPPSEQVFGRCLAYLVRAGYLPAPPRGPGADAQPLPGLLLSDAPSAPPPTRRDRPSQA